MLGPIAGSVKGMVRTDAASRAVSGGDVPGGGEACERVARTRPLDRLIRNQLAAWSVQNDAFTRLTSAAGAGPPDR